MPTVKNFEDKVFTWSNIDGDVSIHNSFDELLKNEDWDYLGNYYENNDNILIGLLREMYPSNLDDIYEFYETHKIFCLLKNTKEIIDWNCEVNFDSIEEFYMGNTIINATPHLAKQKLENFIDTTSHLTKQELEDFISLFSPNFNKSF